MICSRCRNAADTHAPANQHCGNDKCMCGHRTDKYRAKPTSHAQALRLAYAALWKAAQARPDSEQPAP